MLTVSSGHSASYLTSAVASGRENYYTGAVAAGEPPGRWSGRGAERLGLAGEVDTQDMTALYERFIDPRDERFRDPVKWDEAETLGHTGRRYLTEDEIYAAALAAEPGADAERRAALRVEAGKKARKNVAFLDATFSVQKSITVLHTAFEAQEVRARSAAENARVALAGLTGAPESAAVAGGAPTAAGAGAPEAVPGRAAERLTAEIEAAGAKAASWATYRQAVEDAIWAGNQAALEYLAERAGYSRVGHHGGAAGRWVDAHDWTVASFFQHDSRDHDPQLHIHNAVLNRVEGVDGNWRTIDAQAMYRYRGAASAVGDRVMEQHLTRALGVRFAMRPDGRAREIVGIDSQVTDLFSSRRRAITRKTQTLVRAFETRFGRSPNSLELDRLQRQATFASRRSKSHDGETVEQRLERWDSQLRAEVAGGLRQVADDVLERVGERSRGERWKTREVIETALAEVQETKSAWTVPDLTRAIGNALPDDLGTLDPEKVARLLDRLTAKALKLAVPLDARRPGDKQLPDELRLADGGSAYEARGARLYATPAHIHTERLLKAATADRTAPALSDRAVTRLLDGFAESGVELGADQAAAVRGILTSGASVETLVGPAGTGKSFVVGALAKAWQDPASWGGPTTRPATGRRVVGLAASQVATDVLAGEGLTARNIARWLDTQERLLEADRDGRRPRAEDRPWALRAGDLVVVDESAMANTADLAQIHTVCKAAKAKLLLVGDHRQLAAVGAGGAMDLIASSALDGAVTHELAETRRFRQAWEGPASLRLRDRDETGLAEYHKHGRLLDCGPVERAEASAARAWLADTLTGHTSILVVDTNEQAARLSAALRADLVRLGRVDDERRVPLGLQGTFAGVGDLVQARLNEWKLAGYTGNRRGPINRETYRVTAILDDGDLRVITRDGEQITLPAAYVEEHLALGYASTVHAAQGLTVDTAHTVATGATGADALYVGLTRGRHTNTAHVVTEAIPADAPVGTAKQALHRSPQSVLAGAFETTDPQLSALAEAAQSAAETDMVRAPAELLADAAQIATAGRTARWLDELVTEGRLSPAQRAELAAEDGATTLTTVLRRAELAGHDPRRVLTDAIDRRSLEDARQITNVLHRRITETTPLDPVGESYAGWVPQVDDPQWRAYLTVLANAADERRAELGKQVAAEQPQWAREALGALPSKTEERSEWIQRAATVAAHRDLVGHEDTADPLGPAPKPGQVEAYASWRAAWRALGRPEAERAEAEMSIGRLRVRIRAYEREAAWAPRYVANELAGTRQTADKHRRDAAVRRAEAEAREGDQAPRADKAADMEWRAQRLREAAQAEALAAALDARAAELAEADEARARWYAHTAETRAAADRARAELTARAAGGDLGPVEPAVTAEEWLEATGTAARAEDPHREITAEHEVADLEAQRDDDHRAARTNNDAARDGTTDAARSADDRSLERGAAIEHHPSSAAAAAEPEPAPLDIRQQAERDAGVRRNLAETNAEGDVGSAAAPSPTPDADRHAQRSAEQDEDTVRVPSSDETADSVRRAQRALVELRQREVIEERRANDEARSDELSRWHDDDTSASGSGADTASDRDTAKQASVRVESTPPASESDDAGPVLDRVR